MTVRNKKCCVESGTLLSERTHKKKAGIEGQSIEQQELFKSDLRKRSMFSDRKKDRERQAKV